MRSGKFRKEGGLPKEGMQYDEGADRTACFTCKVPEWPNLFSHTGVKDLKSYGYCAIFENSVFQISIDTQYLCVD